MQIYLARNNQQAGPYTVEQLNQMLANQQVLLTDLAWHQGMSEWKALGELTQGKLSYTPQGYSAPIPAPQAAFPQTQSTAQPAQKNLSTTQELASLPKRFLAKILDLLLWLPALVIPTFFLQPEQIEQLGALQQKMQPPQ